MRYRRFGRTELRMPVLSCGGMRFNQTWDQLPLDEVSEESQRNLEEILDAAFAAGINHFETARGYGTSEVQLGAALPRLPRSEIIVQTKIPPKETVEEFEETLRLSFDNLKLEYVDLVAIHGINGLSKVEMSMRCLDVLERWRKDGRIRHVGFSTHDDGETVLEMIESDRFDYVNLHYYYIARKNSRAVELAAKHDMGVFIISPSDKGGKLYAPPAKLRELSAPFTPMQFNDLFCLSTPGIHTLSVGAARPSDFDEHLDILDKLDEDGELTAETRGAVESVVERLDSEMDAVLGVDWVARCGENLPDWRDTPGNVNIPVILRLWNLAKGLDMLDYAKMRYNLLGDGGDWFPGENAGAAAELAEELERSLSESGSPFPKEIVSTLREAHALLANPDKVKK